LDLGAIDVLTMIPHNEVIVKGIPYVKSLLPETELWDRFWKYFEKTWIDRYGIGSWNIYGLENVQGRTNNALERHNRAINDLFPNAHPNLLNFAETIKKQSFETNKTINLIRLGKEKAPDHFIGLAHKIPKAYTDFVVRKKKRKRTEDSTTGT